MKPLIVVEGKTDARILEELLPREVHDKYQIVVAEGRSSAISRARTLLALGRGPVALVVDADTVDRSLIKQQESVLSQLLQSAATGSACEAFIAVPTMDLMKDEDGPESRTSLIRDIVGFVKRNGGLAVAA